MCSLSPLPPINQYFGLEERRRRRRTLIGIEWSLMVHNKSEWMCCNLQARIKFSYSFFSISTARRKHQVECSRTLLAKCPAGCHRACRPCRCQRCQCRPCPCRTCRRSQACERPIRPRKVQRAMAPRSRLLKRSQRPHTRRTTTTAPGEFRWTSPCASFLPDAFTERLSKARTPQGHEKTSTMKISLTLFSFSIFLLVLVTIFLFFFPLFILFRLRHEIKHEILNETWTCSFFFNFRLPRKKIFNALR